MLAAPWVCGGDGCVVDLRCVLTVCACVTSCTARGLAGVGRTQKPVAIIADCGGDAVRAILAGLSVHAITPGRSIGAITAVRTVFAVFYGCFGCAAFVCDCNFCAVCALLYACSGAISVSTRSPVCTILARFAFQFGQCNQIFPRVAVIGAILDVSAIRPHGGTGSCRLVNGRHKGFFGFGGQVVKITDLLLHCFQIELVCLVGFQRSDFIHCGHIIRGQTVGNVLRLFRAGSSVSLAGCRGRFTFQRCLCGFRRSAFTARRSACSISRSHSRTGRIVGGVTCRNARLCRTFGGFLCFCSSSFHALGGRLRIIFCLLCRVSIGLCLAHKLLPCRSARLRHGAVLCAGVAAHFVPQVSACHGLFAVTALKGDASGAGLCRHARGHVHCAVLHKAACRVGSAGQMPKAPDGQPLPLTFGGDEQTVHALVFGVAQCHRGRKAHCAAG